MVGLALAPVLVLAATAGITQIERLREPAMAPNLRLHVTIAGDGPRQILALHGLGGAGGYFANRLSGFAQNHRVLAPDLLGFGESPKPLDASYDLDEHVERILYTLGPELEGRKTLVVGHSFGAVIALALVNRRPDLFPGAVLVSLPVFRGRAEGERQARNLGSMEAGILDDSVLWHASCWLRPLYRVPGGGRLWGVPEDVYLGGTHHVWESLSRTMSHVLDVDSAALARSSTRPLLFIHGIDDDVAPVKSVEALAQSTGARIVVLPGGHQVFLDDPARVWRLVEELEATLR